MKSASVESALSAQRLDENEPAAFNKLDVTLKSRYPENLVGAVLYTHVAFMLYN